MENGNVTTYEWIHGEAPLRIEKSILDFGTSQEDEIQDKNIEIDFDCLDLKVNSMVSDHIEVELEAPTEIDWGDLEIAADNVDIDWDNVDPPRDGLLDAVAADIVVEESGVEGGIARDTEALSILDNRRTRNLVLDELHELEAFFVQRLAEINTLEDGGKVFSLASNANCKISGDPALATEALEDVRALIRQLSTGQLHHLQLVRGSLKYVDRLVDNLKQQLRLIDRCNAANNELVRKRDVAIREQADAQTKLKV